VPAPIDSFFIPMSLLLRASPIFLLALQIYCGIHAYRRGHDRWLWMIILVPGVGSVIYFLAEILPSLRLRGRFGGIGGGCAVAEHPLEMIPFFRARHLRSLEDEVAFAETVDNRTKLAEAYARAGRYDAAAEQYELCLVGPLAQDSDLLFALARAHQARGDFAAMLAVIERVRMKDTDAFNGERRLLQAVALEGCERLEDAAVIYQDLLAGWPGDEVRARLAALLDRKGDTNGARELYRSIRAGLRRSSGFYRQQNQEWIAQAKAWLRADERG
jgi:hypothetical protein